jgi:hypothetical protein
MKKFALLFLFFCALPVLADDTINLDAGELISSSSAPMVADDTSGSVSGSLLLVIDLGSSDTPDPVLTSGDYVSGTNSILAAGGFNNTGGTNETLTAFDIPSSVLSTFSTGDEIALRWFPQITLQQYESGALPMTGYVFGTYSPSGGDPDGGDTWTVPADGSLINLDFYTMNSDGGGNESALDGTASDVVVSAVPEPSTYLLVLLGLPLLFWAYRRRFLV